jgi:hypothetical protein
MKLSSNNCTVYKQKKRERKIADPEKKVITRGPLVEILLELGFWA